MWLFSRLASTVRKNRASRPLPSSRRPHSARPRLELLEDRTLLSTGWIATGSGALMGGARGSAIDIATDSAGDTFVAVNATGTATLGSTTFTGTGYSCLAKVDPSGNWLWATKLADGALVGGGNLNGGMRGGLVVDSSDNVYITGAFSGAATFGSTTLTSAGGTDIFVSKLNGATGSFTWTMQIGGPGNDESHGLGLDGSGNIYLAGAFSNSVNFGTTLLTSAGDYDAFLTKISPNQIVTWAKDIGGANGDYGTALVVDSAGNAYMSLVTNQTNQTNTAVEFVNRYDTNGNSGWSYNGGSPQGGLDSLALFTDSNGQEFLYQTGPYSAGVLKLDGSTGSPLWLKNFNVHGDSIGAYYAGLNGIATDSSGNVYVTGRDVQEFDQPIGFDPATGTGYLHGPFFVTKLDANGSFLAAHSTGGSAVAVDGAGNIHSVGSMDSLHFPNSTWDTGSQDLAPPTGAVMVVGLTTQDMGGVLGRVYADLNNNGVADPGENGLVPVTVYADLNNDGQLNPGEPSTIAVTNALVNQDYAPLFGEYHLNHLAPGAYTIRAVLPQGWTQTTPTIGVTVAAGQDVDNQDFGAYISNQTKTYAASVPVSIPKGPRFAGQTVTSKIAVADQAPILTLSISTNVSGAAGASFTLISPDGLSRSITPNTTTTLTVQFFGHNVHGTWTLQIGTGYGSQSGTLNGWSITVGQANVAAPHIGSFTSSASTVKAGASLTLTASNITDGSPNTTITQVTFFYIDSSGNKVILGNATQTSPGVWKLTFAVNLPTGSYTIYAQAEDSNYFFSDLISLSLTVK